MKLKFYIWLMGWSGRLHAWAWRKQANMIKYSKQKEEEEYLKELKKKLLVKKKKVESGMVSLEFRMICIVRTLI